jgi:hypothetical protein
MANPLFVACMQLKTIQMMQVEMLGIAYNEGKEEADGSCAQVNQLASRRDQ